MPKSYWMVVKSPDNLKIAKERGFDMVGLRHQHRRKVQRMEPGDRVLLYVSSLRCFAATATVTSSLVEDHAPIWKEEGGSDLPYRVGIKPEVILDEGQYINAYQVAPRMDYVRRWIPELWYMAFQGNLHLISKADFNLVEEEMKKVKRGIKPPARVYSNRRPTPLSHCKLDQMVAEDEVGPSTSELSLPGRR